MIFKKYNYRNNCKNYKSAKNQNKNVIRIIIFKLCYHKIYKRAKNQNKKVIYKISNKNLIIINKLIRINYNKNNK